jgi:hypothetical protein
MRSIVTAAVLIALGTAQQTLISKFFSQSLNAEKLDIPFDPKMPCTGCIRSGFDYCSSNSTCLQKADDQLLCSNAYTDKYNYLYSYCKNVPTCEKPGKFSILYNDTKEEQEVSFLKGGEGCTYRVYTPCGYPRLNVTVENADPSEFNIMYSYAEFTET